MKSKKVKFGLVGAILLFHCFTLQSVHAQVVNIDLLGPADTSITLDPAIMYEPYNVTIHPQNPTGQITWETTVALAPTSSFTMQVNGADLPAFLTIDALLGDISFVETGTPIENLTGYLILLTLSDEGGHAVEITLMLPVIRAPISVALVLDRSGSMGWAPAGGSGLITRMQILQTSASLFINKLQFFNRTGDEAALTYFESTIDSPPPAFGNALTLIDGNAASFIGDINAQSAGTATAMGGGLLAGKTKLASATAGNRQFIFLFTDGEQNVAPLVNDLGTLAGVETLNNGDNSIQIVTIGTGGAAGMAPALRLQAIAEENTGKNPPASGTPQYFLLQEEINTGASLIDQGNDFNTFTGIAGFFDAGFETMLQGGSPQTVDVVQGLFPSESEVKHQFEINANIDKIAFELLTTDREPLMRVFKGDTLISQANYDIEFIYGPNNGTNSLLAIINLKSNKASRRIKPLSSHGIWNIDILSGSGGGKPYQLKAQVDDHSLNYNFTIKADDFKVNDILDFAAKLSYDGLALEDGNIDVVVLKPGEDLGDLLATADINFDASSAPESGSIGYQKLLEAVKNNPELIEKLKLGKNVVSLNHTSDGNYSGQFSDTDVSGVYQIFAQISGASTKFGSYKRLLRRTVYIRFGDPEPEVSEISQTSNGKTTTLVYTPKYTVGNKVRFVGPGFAQGMRVTGNDVKQQSVIDNADGSYTINLRGKLGTDYQIHLSGVKVYDTTKSNITTVKTFCNWVVSVLSIPCWLALLILLILLIIIILIVRKKSKK